MGLKERLTVSGPGGSTDCQNSQRVSFPDELKAVSEKGPISCDEAFCLHGAQRQDDRASHPATGGRRPGVDTGIFKTRVEIYY